jgi:hypothetical protein
MGRRASPSFLWCSLLVFSSDVALSDVWRGTETEWACRVVGVISDDVVVGEAAGGEVDEDAQTSLTRRPRRA